MSYPDVLSVPLGMGKRTVKASLQGRTSQGFDFKGGAATHVDDVAKGLGKVLDDIPTTALKPSTATNAGRNLTESGTKSAGRVGDAAEDGLEKVAGKSSSVSRNADEGIDYGKQAGTKSPAKPADSKVTDLNEYKAKKAGTSKPPDEDIDFGKSGNNDVQSMDMAENLGSKSSNVISMDVQAKAPIKKKVVNGFDYDDSVDLPQTQLKVVDNTAVNNGSEVTANVGRSMDTAVDAIPSASGASRGSSSAGKILTEGIGDIKKTQVNIDTGTANAFISEGSTIRHQLKNYVDGKEMVMTETALKEFKNIVQGVGGSLEQARAERFLQKVTIIEDNPSQRALALNVTKKVGSNDKVIFGTGDNLGITTMTSDAKFLRGAEAQGVSFDAYVHEPVPLRGK